MSSTDVDATQGRYSHDQILSDSNLGTEPSERYLKVVDMFDNVVRDCIYVSRGFGGIPSPSTRHFFASVLFTALITRGVSLAHLMPFGPWAEKKIEHWDYASVAVITRTMLELRIAFYYLCVDECTPEEWDCRWNIFNLHDCVSRFKLFSATGNHESSAAFDAEAEHLRDRLRVNPHFRVLPAGQQRKLLHGQTAYLHSLEDIAVRAGIERERFQWIYVLLSSHVHGLPMSFYRLAEGDRGRDLPSPVEEGYTSMCLTFASTFLLRTRDEVQTLFTEFRERAEALVARESAEASAAAASALNDPPKSEGMKVGETVTLAETSDLVLESTMAAPNVVRTVCKHKGSGEEVLRRIDSEQGVVLEDFDPNFWIVILNGGAATKGLLEAALSEPYAFRIDHTTRTIEWKTNAIG